MDNVQTRATSSLFFPSIENISGDAQNLFNFQDDNASADMQALVPEWISGMTKVAFTRCTGRIYHWILSRGRTYWMTSRKLSPINDRPVGRVWFALSFGTGVASPKKDCMVSMRLWQGGCASLSNYAYTDWWNLHIKTCKWDVPDNKILNHALEIN